MITDYEYERYFYTGSHRKCLLFVEQDANVAISEGKPPVITKTGGDPLIITNENILKERFELQENFNSSENWAFGSVEPSVISFDIREDGTIPLLEGTTFRLYLYFDGNSSTIMYIGTYTIDEDELSDDSKSRSISGYDMVQTIRNIDIIDFYRDLFNAKEVPDPEDPEQTIWVPAKEKIKVKDARDAFFEYLADKENGEGLPIIQEIVDLPNDDFEFAFDVDTEALSGGQFIEDICEINGRYGHFGRKLSTASSTKNYATFQYIRVERYDEYGEKIGNDVRMNGMKKGLFETASIGRLRVYNRDSVLIGYYDEGYKKKFSKYNIFDNILIDDLTKNKTTKADMKAMLSNIYDSIRYRKYVPFQAKAPADLCREVGDRITLYLDIDMQDEEGEKKNYYKTLIFTRKITGIQNMVDTYSAKGDKKLPEFGDYASSGGYSASGSSSGKAGTTNKEGTDGDYMLESISAADLRLYLKNVGIQTLDEPTNVTAEVVKTNNGVQIELKWTDPANISTWTPYPAEWEGTVVIRKEGTPPKYRWDGVTKVKNSTTRDAYKTDAFVDTNVTANKTYYYGFYPYFTEIDSSGTKIRHYTWTKIVKVSTDEPVSKPDITKLFLGEEQEPWDGTEIDFLWSGNSNKMTCQILNGAIVFKMYTSSTLIYTFTSPVGSSVNDVDKINVSFLIDADNHLAKPSFVYKNGSTYDYNQESPTDAEMGDIYTWVSAGLPT